MPFRMGRGPPSSTEPPSKNTIDLLATGKNVVIVIDVQGAASDQKTNAGRDLDLH